MLGRFRVDSSPKPTPSSPYTSFLSSPSPFLPPPTPLASKKRTKSNAENIPPPDHVPFTPTPMKRLRTNQETPLRIQEPWKFSKPVKLAEYLPTYHNFGQDDTQRLELIFDAIQYVGWSFGKFLHVASLNPCAPGCHRSQQHAQTVSRFLRGQDEHTPIQIVNQWYTTADTRLRGDEDKEDLMYSIGVPYVQIKPFRPALSSFAVQFCAQKLEREAKLAAKPTSGLHATTKKKGRFKLEWKSIGISTTESCQEVLQTCLPTAYHFLMQIAGLESPKRRPSSLVTIHALSSLLFTRNNESRLLPLSLGLLSFAYSAPVDLMAYLSRIGVMPAYNTIYSSLERLAIHQGGEVKEQGRDPGVVYFIQCDNVQNYLPIRDQRIGSTPAMNIGIASTFCILNDVDPDALDYEDKKRRVANSTRSKLTAYDFLRFIDSTHLDAIFALHWVRILVTYIPQLAHLQPQLSTLFRTEVKKTCIPKGQTPIFPLASSGKSETIFTELKDAVHDMLSQAGNTKEDFTKRLVLVGGDGLTFQRLLELQRYLQFHEDDLESLAIVEPVLAVWHTKWTDVSRIYETHFDSKTSEDPSSLGHSAAILGRPGPPNLKKVDYYPAVDLMYLVLAVRVLDCWRLHFNCDDIFQYFEDLASLPNRLPTMSQLRDVARKLHQAYSSNRGIYNALGDTKKPTTWAEMVPLGPDWTAPRESPTTDSTTPRHENGDRVLANSITFMRDAILSQEISYAIAEGDAGRVYECMKVLLFTFGGSTHQKYCTYLLEMITRLELESSPSLRDAILKSTLVNLSGHDGACSASDIMQEYFNRLLEAIIQRKGIKYGDRLARKVVSPNLAHFAHIKLNLRSGLGLAPRSGRHSAPHENPEVRKLMAAYKNISLHKRVPGRVINETDRDDFARGFNKLLGGKVQTWAKATSYERDLLGNQEPVVNEMVSDDIGDLEDSEAVVLDSRSETFGLTEMHDGELVTETFSEDILMDSFDDFLTDFDMEQLIM